VHQARRAAVAVLLLGMAVALPAFALDARRAPESNTLVPAGDMHYAPSAFPERIVATPARDAATGFAVAWRTNAGIETPVLEIVAAGDSPDMGEPRRIPASTRALRTENGLAHHHRADVGGLAPDTLYAWRVQGAGGWWSPWLQLRTGGRPGTSLTRVEAFFRVYKDLPEGDGVVALAGFGDAAEARGLLREAMRRFDAPRD